jgi:hypothetical protein
LVDSLPWGFETIENKRRLFVVLLLLIRKGNLL